MLILRSCLLFQSVFLTFLLFGQITWDGSQWSTHPTQPTVNDDVIINGDLQMNQVAANQILCRDLTINAGFFINFDMPNGLIHVNSADAGGTITNDATAPLTINPGITGCVFKITTSSTGAGNTIMAGSQPLDIPDGVQLFVEKPSSAVVEANSLIQLEPGSFYFNDGAAMDNITGKVIIRQRGKSPTTAYNLWSRPNQDDSTINYIFGDPLNSSSGPGAAWTYTDGGTSVTDWNAATSFVMTNGVGYMITGNGAVLPATPTYSFTGALNTGNVNVLTAAAGWKLIGNPYACFLDLHNGSTGLFDVNTHLTGTAYFWIDDLSTGSGYTHADWASWNNSGTVTANSVTPEGNVAVAQGFFVETTSTANVVFKTSMQIGVSESFHKTPAQDIQRFWLQLIDSNGVYSETLIAFTDSATLGFDRCYDGAKSLVDGNIALYTSLQGEPYMIQAYPKLFSSQVIPLGVITNDDGDFTFNLKAVDNLPVGTSLVLEDQYTNTFHLLDSSDYVVNLQQDTFDNRFFIHVNMLATEIIEESTKDLIYVYHNNGLAHISGLRNCGFISSIEAYDLSGRRISHSIINRELSDFAIDQLGKGVYFIRIESEVGTFVKKIFI